MAYVPVPESLARRDMAGISFDSNPTLAGRRQFRVVSGHDRESNSLRQQSRRVSCGWLALGTVLDSVASRAGYHKRVAGSVGRGGTFRDRELPRGDLSLALGIGTMRGARRNGMAPIQSQPDTPGSPIPPKPYHDSL